MPEFCAGAFLGKQRKAVHRQSQRVAAEPFAATRPPRSGERRCARLEHDPEKHALGPRPDGWVPVFRKDHAPTKRKSGMTIRRKVIPLWRFFWVCAIPNGPDRMAVRTSAASVRRRRLLPRWPLLYRVVFEAWKMLARGTNARRSGLNEG